VAETLRLEIGAMIEGELVDPRIDFCYVTEVALNPGAKSARVYVAVDSAVKEHRRGRRDTIAGLEAAKGYIRYELKERMGVRHVPELSFLADRSGRFQARIEELMNRRASGKRLARSSASVRAEPARKQRTAGVAAHESDSLESALEATPSLWEDIADAAFPTCADTAEDTIEEPFWRFCAVASGSWSVRIPGPTAMRWAAC
jgi:ribosome-binding factor A